MYFGKRLDANSILIVDEYLNSLFLFLSLNFNLEIDLISIGLEPFNTLKVFIYG